MWTCCDILFYLTQDDDCLATRHSQGAIEGTPKVFAPEALGIIRLFRCTVIIFGAPWRSPKSYCKEALCKIHFRCPSPFGLEKILKLVTETPKLSLPSRNADNCLSATSWTHIVLGPMGQTGYLLLLLPQTRSSIFHHDTVGFSGWLFKEIDRGVWL